MSSSLEQILFNAEKAIESYSAKKGIPLTVDQRLQPQSQLFNIWGNPKHKQEENIYKAAVKVLEVFNKQAQKIETESVKPTPH